MPAGKNATSRKSVLTALVLTTEPLSATRTEAVAPGLLGALDDSPQAERHDEKTTSPIGMSLFDICNSSF
jgi:hypothetical protein